MIGLEQRNTSKANDVAVENISRPTSLLCTSLSGEHAGKSCERIGTRESITGKVLLKFVFGSVSATDTLVFHPSAMAWDEPFGGSAMMVGLSVVDFGYRFGIIRRPSNSTPNSAVPFRRDFAWTPLEELRTYEPIPVMCISRFRPPSTSKLAHNVVLKLQVSNDHVSFVAGSRVAPPQVSPISASGQHLFGTRLTRWD